MFAVDDKHKLLIRGLEMANKSDLTTEQRTYLQRLEMDYIEAIESTHTGNSADSAASTYAGSSADSAGELDHKDLYTLITELDRDVKNKAKTAAIAEGLAGTVFLITGYNFITGMSGMFLSGVIMFCLGTVLLAATYPMFNVLLRKGREKYAHIVITITDYLT